KLDLPGHGTVETISNPIFVAGSEKRRAQAAPDVGANTREVLRALGYADSAIDEMVRRGAAAVAG
ncbi:MAG TPA: hypothetical protein VEU51_06745, partial [Candidatus Acidoferrales bacterium]|nr:hypothetical protein [Candidatus Acidoferrales bacterium]